MRDMCPHRLAPLSEVGAGVGGGAGTGGRTGAEGLADEHAGVACVCVCRLRWTCPNAANLVAFLGRPAQGRVEEGGTRLACAYHGWEFDGDGRCTRVPQVGAPR